jgi:N utilization substance protein B
MRDKLLIKYDKTIAREIALQGIYQLLQGQPLEEILKFEWTDDEEIFEDELKYRNKEFIKSFAKKLLEKAGQNLEEINEIIDKHFTKNPETISTIDKALIILGITSLKYFKDIPPAVSIDETVTLAKSFGSTNYMYKVVNKILDSINKNQNI